MMLWDWLKSKHSEYYAEHQTATVFVEAMTVIGILFIISMAVTNGRTLASTLVYVQTDTFMDYFNSVVFGLSDPYSNPRVIYPPLITAIYMVIAKYTNDFVFIYGNDYSIDMRNSEVPMMVFIIITLLTIVLLQSVIEKNLKDGGCGKFSNIMFFTILLSYPVLWTLERGNSLMYTVPAVMLFITGYNSNNIFIRLASYVAIGFAAGIKISPAFFTLLILSQRRYMEFLACIGIMALMVLAPFAYTGGSIEVFMNHGLSYNDSVIPIVNFRNVGELLGLSGNAIFAVSGVFILLTAVLCIWSGLEEWEKILLISCVCIEFFALNTPYLTLYLLVALIPFLVQNRCLNRKSIIYLVFFVIVFAMIPTPFETYGTLAFAKFSCIFVAMMMLFGYGIYKLFRPHDDGGRECGVD